MTGKDTPMDRTEQKRFVLSCERKYQNQIRKMATALSDDPDVSFLMLTGGSCSGKTTSSELLKAELNKRGRRAVIVSIDDFYRDRQENSHNGTPDYESVSAIDLDTFIDCASAIQSGHPTPLPRFDFQLGRRSGFVLYTPEHGDLIVFEGIQALYPEIVGIFPKKRVRTAYTAVNGDLAFGETVFDAREIRLMRRIVRDYRDRSSSVGRTLMLWDHVIQNEERNILPNVQNPTFSVNTLLAYEVNVMKPFILNREMYDFSAEKEKKLYAHWAEKLKCVEEFSADLVPKNSVFREFIG